MINKIDKLNSKFLLIITFIFTFNSLSAQINWTKYSNNPVMVKQDSIFETYAIGQPSCIIENDTFKMWYVEAGLPYATSRMAYAYSLDGINWVKKHNLFESGQVGEWDGWMDTPEIIRDKDGYKLYYFGDTMFGYGGSKPSSLASLGLATSEDGITWTKYSGNPILAAGNTGEWDDSWIESPAILYDESTSQYMMWYSGVDTNTWHISTGLATSTDGFSWTKYAGNPVLNVGVTGAFDDMWVAVPAVIKRDSIFEMWYSALSSTTGFEVLYIGYATSTDGINWKKHTANPLFTTKTTPYDSLVDHGGPWAPDVIFDSVNNEFKMWYETAAGFCLATAPLEVVSIEDNLSLQSKVEIIYYRSDQTIHFNTNDNQVLDNLRLAIFDIRGREIIRTNDINNTELTLKSHQLSSGIYICKLFSKQYVLTKKILITK